ncbi:hypothetical protein KP509_35G054200 [Ceratopteris richardii]|uniref:Uncharacterized protein n=1 Tax=Ceratopteris richardii TaxID=49495 RepID=A0A8T2QHA3_CERRI|nr:hypothetical protein KP509_35G054200 [Ceratopteris richardii]
MSKGIKTAFGVFEGFKLIQKLHSPSAEDALLLGPGGNWVFLSVKVTKFFAKGLKMTQKVLTSSPVSKLIFQGRRSNAVVERLVYGDLASVVKGFNAVYSAIRVAQFTKSFGKLPMPQEELRLRSVNFIWKGYTFSKSIMNILDVIAGKNGWALAYMGKGFFIMKKAIEGFGVMAKAIFLSKELGLVVLKRAAISGGTFAVVFSTYSRSQKGLPLCQSIGGKDGKLSLVCTLFKCSLEELESVNTNAFEEHDPQMILCLALPIGNGEIPVSAC